MADTDIDPFGKHESRSATKGVLKSVGMLADKLGKIDFVDWVLTYLWVT